MRIAGSRSLSEKTESTMTPIRTASTLELAEEWSLVLEAEGFAPEIRNLGEEFVVLVPSGDASRAVQTLWAYESENQPAGAPDTPEWKGRGPVLTGIAIAGAIVAFFFVSTISEPTLQWHERGMASAGSILRGELWRTVTALTLHADAAHAVSNAIAAAFFVTLAGTVVGPGAAAALILATGAAGNLLNAVLHGPPHASVGASTAIFGAIGLLGGIGFARRRREPRSRGTWLPLAASIALLAMIGTSGPRVDLWAHLLGVAMGGVAGVSLTALADRPMPLDVQRKLGIVTTGVIFVSWLMAFA